jgi:hypothetical protein
MEGAYGGGATAGPKAMARPPRRVGRAGTRRRVRWRPYDHRAARALAVAPLAAATREETMTDGTDDPPARMAAVAESAATTR